MNPFNNPWYISAILKMLCTNKKVKIRRVEDHARGITVYEMERGGCVVRRELSHRDYLGPDGRFDGDRTLAHFSNMVEALEMKEKIGRIGKKEAENGA